MCPWREVSPAWLLGCVRNELTLLCFPGDACSACWHQQRRTGACTKQGSLPSGSFFWVFSSRLSVLLTPACSSRDCSHSLISLINVNTSSWESYFLKQGCDSDVQEHFKSSGDHLVSSPLLNFPLPTLQNKCNVIHFPDSFNINIWYLYLWYKHHNHHLCGKQELAQQCNSKEQ